MKAVNTTASLALALIFCLTAALGIAAAVEAPPSLMSRADRLEALRAIARDGRLALAHCRTLASDSDRSLFDNSPLQPNSCGFDRPPRSQAIDSSDFASK